MRAVAISRPGGPEVLQLVSRPWPPVSTGCALIKVHAAGVNRPDILQRMGLYPPPADATDLPGLEVAGEIVGGDLSNSPWQIGDAVCALLAGGGYAEYAQAPIGQMLPVPRGLSFVEAAALPETLFTVWSNVFERGALAKAERLLVHGGSSGIGVAAVQIAVARGHEVFATAGSQEKCLAVLALGAKRAINYKDEDFVAAIKQETKNHGVDVILDMVAGEYTQRNVECLTDDGRLVTIAVQGGDRSTIHIPTVMRRRLTLTGSTLRARSVAFKSALALRVYSHVWPLLESGAIKAMVTRTYALEEVQEAHAQLESGTHIGKIVLTVGEKAHNVPQRRPDVGIAASA